MKTPGGKRNIIFLSLIAVIVIGVAVAVSLLLRVNIVDETLRTEGVLNTLWILTDEERNVYSTNVIASYPQTNQAASFDIVGNTGAIFNTIGRVDRIDAVYKERGVDAYREEIETLIGKTIPFTIEIYIDDLEMLTDFFGGLDVFIPFPIDEEREDGKHFLFPSGAVVLDGDKALDYILYTKPDDTENDIDERHQGVFIAFLTVLGENRDMLFERNNFSFFEERFHSNLSGNNLKTLLEQVSLIDIEHMTLQKITGSIRIVDGKQLLFPYYDGQLIKDIVNQSINTLVSQSSTLNRIYVLIIQNGTDVQGLARNTSFLMQSAGYEVLEAVNADRNYEKTVIIDHIGNQEAAQTLGNFIRCDNISEEELVINESDEITTARADFTIILGQDFDGRYVNSN